LPGTNRSERSLMSLSHKLGCRPGEILNQGEGAR
jgi:hypothetical protein